MNISKRVVLSLLIAAILLFFAMLFWPFVVTNIIQPVALVLWLLLRILVLSIDQKFFWYAVIFAAFMILLRVLRPEKSDPSPETYQETNATLIRIGYWHGLFVYDGQTIHDQKSLKRELTYLLTSLYASRQGTSNYFRVQEALQRGKIPLPEHICTFLFPPEPPRSGGPIKRFLRSIRKTVQIWIHRWTGKEKAEHYQTIEEVLRFMETSLEMKNDDTNLLQNRH